MAISLVFQRLSSILVLCLILLALHAEPNAANTDPSNSAYKLQAKNNFEALRLRNRSHPDYQASTRWDAKRSALFVFDSSLTKRVTESESGADSTQNIDLYVRSLWLNAPASNKVATGQYEVFHLDPTKSDIFTTGECFGCTAVILASGKMVLIAHFKEESGNINLFRDDTGFLNTVIIPLQAALARNKEALGPNPSVVIFTPAANKVAEGQPIPYYYGKRIQDGQGGKDTILSTITDDFKVPLSITIAAYVKLHPTANAFEDNAAGKLVVEWKAPKSACGSNGIGTLAIYAEDNWIVNKYVNANGDEVLPNGALCGVI